MSWPRASWAQGLWCTPTRNRGPEAATFPSRSAPRPLRLARADGTFVSMGRRLRQTQLVVSDDWGLVASNQQGARDTFDRG